MNKSLFRIDVSSRKVEEDLIKIRFKNEEVLLVDFSKLFYRSKYIRDKYKYSEALNSIQDEIEETERQLNISDLSIKYFIQLIEEETIDIPIEHYKDIYTLSEYFCIPKFTAELDKISRKELFNDLDFTIQILLNSETAKNSIETKLTCKIENFLIKQINECIKNPKFSELPISTIFRILDHCKEIVNHDLLVDFIIESVETRFILFKLVELQKLTENKVNEMIKFIGELEEPTKKMCLDYMTFNFQFIKNIKYSYDQLLNEMKQTKYDLKQTKNELKQTKDELNQTKDELNQTKDDLKQTKDELNQTKVELNQTKDDLKQTKDDLKQTKDDLNQTKDKLKQTKVELNQTGNELKNIKDEINRVKNEKYIIVAGNESDNQLGEKPNNKNKTGTPIIHPPLKLPFDPSSLLSYSAYYENSVLVMNDGSLKGVGNNKGGQISATLQKTVIDDFTDFCIKDRSGRQLAAVSAVCCEYDTLYMFSKSSGNERQLVLCDCDINGGNPAFLDIGNHHPVSLFGGFPYSAAIGSEGEVIFINRYALKHSSNLHIEAVSLPEGEKASSVSFCDSSVFVLSQNGRVFLSNFDFSGSLLKFSAVSELSGQEIVCVSGTYDHCLAVNKKGVVFGRGSNKHGQLGLGEGTKSVLSFTKISSLRKYKIRAAYAGAWHSLFETDEGKILSCGYNTYGQLLLNRDPGENVYLPTETMIKSGATFCIAGCNISSIFIGINPPPNTPNTRVQQYK